MRTSGVLPCERHWGFDPACGWCVAARKADAEWDAARPSEAQPGATSGFGVTAGITREQAGRLLSEEEFNAPPADTLERRETFARADAIRAAQFQRNADTLRAQLFAENQARQGERRRTRRWKITAKAYRKALGFAGLAIARLDDDEGGQEEYPVFWRALRHLRAGRLIVIRNRRKG